jgi:hypothetical protein
MIYAISSKGKYPGRGWESGCKSRQARRNHPIHTADLKPEAVYFTDDSSRRTAFLFVEMNDASQIPAIADPWFLALNASTEIHPVMIPEDLARASGAIETAAKKYSRQQARSMCG